MPAALSIDHITLVASDFEASRRFYAALLPLIGFARRDERTWKNDAGLFVQLVQAEAGTRPYERRGPGVNHIGFAAPSYEFVDQTRAGLAAAGFDVPDIQVFGPTRAIFFKDPDGFRVEISHAPPGIDPVD